MHPIATRAKARALYSEGVALREIGRRISVPYDTVRYWCKITKTPDSHFSDRVECPRCSDQPMLPQAPKQYAYLLGQYLGDGYVVLKARVPVLRISCTTVYPEIMDECEAAMRAVLGRKVQRVKRAGCTNLQSYSVHRKCLFPQAGPGKKHERKIELADWQEEVVEAHAGKFVRGLFHSDGCRVVNQVRVKGALYAYPRYFPSNESADILALCGTALDLLGVAWRRNRGNSLSVAKRHAVSIMDSHIGPKS